MEITARPATVDDVPLLATLAAEAIAERASMRGGDVWRRQQARPLPPADSLQADVDDPDAHVILGEIDGTAVGYGVVLVEELRDGSRLATITDLFTLEGARGVGVGEEVMEALVAWADGRGCFGVDSVALPGDRHTKNFFETFGLVARAIVVHRPLRGGG